MRSTTTSGIPAFRQKQPQQRAVANPGAVPTAVREHSGASRTFPGRTFRVVNDTRLDFAVY